VFGRGTTISAAKALSQWERLKRDEKPKRSGLDGVPQALPALLRATRVQAKAARLGFEWRKFRDALAKFDEESGELKRALRSGRRAAIRHELGDTFFALAKVAKFLHLDPEDTLQMANDRFIERFHALERRVATTGRKMHDLPVARLQSMWRLASRSRLRRDAEQRPERAKRVEGAGR
jgi:ATP diphosphatase